MKTGFRVTFVVGIFLGVIWSQVAPNEYVGIIGGVVLGIFAGTVGYMVTHYIVNGNSLK